VLRACRRILRPGGRTGFTTIVVASRLSKKAHRRAVSLGPRATASTRPLDELTTAAGFVEVDVVDVTDAFLVTARSWLSEWSRHEAELRPILGDDLDERRSDRQDLIRGVEEGLLKRVLVTAVASRS
jgi:cyclopropane fatty-acyl-phospholipid synthase-like methyltransferase